MSNEVNHTPGPWEAHAFMVKAGRDVITQTGYSSSFAGKPSKSSECEANARLIAAAPDLLIAAQRCLNFIEGTEAEFGEEFECGNLARAAIAKAEGK